MHCTHCGAATTELPGTMHRKCPKCGGIDYVNPAPAVGLAFVKDGHILLCRRAHEPNKGQWDLVGGFIEAGETPEQALEREVLEETGCAVASVRIQDIQPGLYAGKPTLNFLATGQITGNPRAAGDVAELRFHPLNQLPRMAWPHEAAFVASLK